MIDVIHRAEFEADLSVDDDQLFAPGLVTRQDKDHRDCLIGWVWPTDSPDLFASVYAVLREINRKHYRYDIDCIPYMQYTVYREGHHYEWHHDVHSRDAKTPFTQRKLTWVVQLSDPESYEGGNLELLEHNAWGGDFRAKGYIYTFPSWLMHRATEVTKGERRALVGWVEGPRWR